jgi:hypothetical protein
VIKIEAYGHVKDGVLSITGKSRFNEDLKALNDAEVMIIIKKRGKRSNPQLRYYWGVVVQEIRIEFRKRGIRATSEEIHEALKLKFNPVKTIDENSGEVLLELGGTTTEMNVGEMSEYLERVIEWCSKSLEIIIPEPGSQTQMFSTVIAERDESLKTTIVS